LFDPGNDLEKGRCEGYMGFLETKVLRNSMCKAYSIASTSKGV